MDTEKKGFRLRTKLLIGLLITLIAIVAVVTLVIAEMYRDRMEEYYLNVARNIDGVVADEITAQDVESFLADKEEAGRFDMVHTKMNSMIREFNLMSLYVIVPQEEGYLYVIDGAEYDSEDYCPAGMHDKFYGEDGQEKLEAVWNGAEAQGSISNSKEYGYLASVAGIITDGKGNSVAAVITDISIEMINSQIRNMVINAVLAATIVALVTMFLYFVYIRMIVINPIRKLEKAATEFPKSEDEEGNLHVSEERYNSTDEIGSLFNAVINMEQSIVTFMHNLKIVTSERERIGAELNVATQIQASYLPSIFPPYPDRDEFEIYATMDPAKEVGGDFYDFFFIDHDHLGLVMADVSGKGVGAALFMMISKTFLNSSAHTMMDPAEILAHVNDRLCENNVAEMFVTVWLGILDIRTGKMVAANGGHEFPMIKRAGGKFELFNDKHGFVLGGMPGIKYKSYELQINKGDSIFLYTDGVPEATDNNNELFGTDRTLEALNINPDASVEQLLKNVRGSIDEFVGEAEQFDDITMLAFEYKG